MAGVHQGEVGERLGECLTGIFRPASVGIKPWPAQPIDGAVATNERRRFAVPEERVILDPLGHQRVLFPRAPATKKIAAVTAQRPRPAIARAPRAVAELTAMAVLWLRPSNRP